MVKDWQKRAEATFVVLSLLLFSNGPLLVVLTNGASQGDEVDIPSGFPLIQLSFVLIYGICLLPLSKQRKRASRLLWSEKSLAALCLLALLSVSWSVAPKLAFKRAAALAGTTLFGLYLATRFTPEERLKLLGRAMVVAMSLSLVFVLLLPRYGVMSGPVHDGIWRGIYAHKNGLGLIASLSSMLFLLLLWKNRNRLYYGLAYCLSLLMLVFSTSKSAILILAVVLLFIGLFFLRGKEAGLSALSVVTGLLLACYLAAHVAFNFSPPALWSNRQAPEPAASPSLGMETHPAEEAAVAPLVQSERLVMTGRINLWKVLLDPIRERPFLGFGYQSFWQGEKGPSAIIWLSEVWKPGHAHNGYIDLVLDLGVLGLAFFLIGLSRAILKLQPPRFWSSPSEVWPAFFLLFFVLSNLGESELVKHNKLLFVLYACVVFSRYGEPRE